VREQQQQQQPALMALCTLGNICVQHWHGRLYVLLQTLLAWWHNVWYLCVIVAAGLVTGSVGRN
jgi:hypothetical protein